MVCPKGHEVENPNQTTLLNRSIRGSGLLVG